jgi:hypothetical protein
MPLIAIVLAIFLIPVAGIVVYCYLKTRKPGDTFRDTVGVGPFTFGACLLFATGSFLGFAVTIASSPTFEHWWRALAARVAWQFGSALLVVIAVCREVKWDLRTNRAALWFAVSVAAIGALLCLNPILDLIQGPLVVRGTASVEVERSTEGGPGSIWVKLRLRSAEGRVEEVHLHGWDANQALDKLDGRTSGQEVQIAAFRHSGKLLDVRVIGPNR